MEGPGCPGSAQHRVQDGPAALSVQPGLLELEALRVVPRRWQDDSLAAILGPKSEPGWGEGRVVAAAVVVAITGVWQDGSMGKGACLMT